MHQQVLGFSAGLESTASTQKSRDASTWDFANYFYTIHQSHSTTPHNSMLEIATALHYLKCCFWFSGVHSNFPFPCQTCHADSRYAHHGHKSFALFEGITLDHVYSISEQCLALMKEVNDLLVAWKLFSVCCRLKSHPTWFMHDLTARCHNNNQTTLEYLLSD